MNISELFLKYPEKYHISGATYDTQYESRIKRIDKIIKKQDAQPTVLFGVSLCFEERDEEGYDGIMHRIGSPKAVPIEGGKIHYTGMEDSVSVTFQLPNQHDELTLVSASFGSEGNVFTDDKVMPFRGFVASPDYDVYLY